MTTTDNKLMTALAALVKTCTPSGELHVNDRGEARSTATPDWKIVSDARAVVAETTESGEAAEALKALVASCTPSGELHVNDRGEARSVSDPDWRVVSRARAIVTKAA